MYFRCCRHCREDDFHDPDDVNRHAVPCGGDGPWGVCSDGGDRWYVESDPAFDEDPEEWCPHHQEWYDSCPCYNTP